MSAAHTVMFDTRRYFGAMRHASFEAACAWMLANVPRSFGIVVRDASGKRWSVREVEDLRNPGVSAACRFLAHRNGGAA